MMDNGLSFEEIIYLSEEAARNLKQLVIQNKSKKILKVEFHEVLSSLLQKINLSYEITKEKIEFYETENNVFVERKANIYKQIDQDDAQLSDLGRRLAIAMSNYNDINRDIYDLEDILNQINSKISNYNEKAKKFDKWFWVPGYNIYLGVDLIVDEPEIKRLLQKRRDLDNQLSNAILEIDSIKKYITISKTSSLDIEKQLFMVEHDLYENIKNINENKRNLLQYMQLYDYFGDLKEKLDYLNLDKIINSLESLGKDLGKLVEVEVIPSQNDKYIRGLQYKGNTIYRGQRLYRGQYIASLNKRFVAIMQDDGNFVVYNYDKPIWASNTFGKDNYLEFNQEQGIVMMVGDSLWHTKNGSADILIMQDDGNLVMYRENYEPVWASDTWMYFNSNTEKFYVGDLDYSGIYSIKGETGLFLDIEGRSLESGARLISWMENAGENQKFIFEKFDDETYTIKAVHSNKLLETYESIKENGIPIIQNVYNGSENQRWYIVECARKKVKIVNADSKKCMNMFFESIGNAVVQHRDNGENSQKFSLIRRT